jgi:hypothetical protein
MKDLDFNPFEIDDSCYAIFLLMESSRIAKAFGKAAARGLIRDTDGVDLWKAHAPTILALSRSCLVIAEQIQDSEPVTRRVHRWLLLVRQFLDLRETSRMYYGRCEQFYTDGSDNLDWEYRIDHQREIAEVMQEIRDEVDALNPRDG